MRIIRGKYGRRRFDVPTNITARPTTDFARENIFNVIENLIDIDGSDVLDLFSGTGAIAFEFLSRGAGSVTAVEKAATQSRFISKVAAMLGDENLRLIRGDAFRYLSSAPGNGFDIVFADPPYDMERFDEVSLMVIDGGIVRPGGIFILEHSQIRDYSALPHFHSRRVYGSVNFSIFLFPDNNAAPQ